MRLSLDYLALNNLLLDSKSNKMDRKNLKQKTRSKDYDRLYYRLNNITVTTLYHVDNNKLHYNNITMEMTGEVTLVGGKLLKHVHCINENVYRSYYKARRPVSKKFSLGNKHDYLISFALKIGVLGQCFNILSLTEIV